MVCAVRMQVEGVRKELRMIPVSIQTLVLAPAPQPSVLVLCPTKELEAKETCRVVPIWIGATEAAQLGLALEGTKLGRPLTHDLMLDALTNLDATIERVEITDVEGQTFIARLVLRAGERTITLDARPSDAVALAVRQNAPVLMAQRVLDEASFPFVFRASAHDNERELDEFREFIQSLSPEDFKE